MSGNTDGPTDSNEQTGDEARADHHIADAIAPLIRRNKTTRFTQEEPAPSQQEMQHLLAAAEKANVSPSELAERLSRVVEKLDELPDDLPEDLPPAS